MIWLITWLTQHAAAIAIIGATAGAIAQVEAVVINTNTIIEKVIEGDNK